MSKTSFRSRPKNVPSITGSKDLQNVNITLRILFRPRPDSLPNIYTTLGVDYDDRVLPSITNEVIHDHSRLFARMRSI